jgi:hypothetical protein
MMQLKTASLFIDSENEEQEDPQNNIYHSPY